MASPNEYQGYVKLPNRKPSPETIRLDFNAHIDSRPEGTRLDGFSLRLSALGRNPREDQPEISITLRPEEWLDLIDALKDQFESVQKARKNFEDMR